MGEKVSMKSFKHVIAALLTACLLAASILNVEASEAGALKNADAKGFANGASAAGTLLAAGTSKTESAKKAGSSDAAAVADSAHSNVGESVNDTCNHHNDTYNTGGYIHNVGIELHQHHGGQDESKVVTEVTEQIAKLVPETKGTDVFLVHLKSHSFHLLASIVE